MSVLRVVSGWLGARAALLAAALVLALVGVVLAVAPVVPGAVKPAAAAEVGCTFELHDVSSTVRKVYDSWSPGCASDSRGLKFHSRYFIVETGSSGNAAFVVESCTDLWVAVRPGSGNTTGHHTSQAFSGYQISGDQSRVRAWAPFTQPRGVAVLRHTRAGGSQDVAKAGRTWNPLYANTTYTVEVSAVHALQLGEFTLQYSDGDTGFTATPGYCSATGDSGRLKAPPSRTHCAPFAFQFIRYNCLRTANPRWWRSLDSNEKAKAVAGDYSVFRGYLPACAGSPARSARLPTPATRMAARLPTPATTTMMGACRIRRRR